MSVCVQVAYAAEVKACGDEKGFAHLKGRYEALERVATEKGAVGYKEPLDGPYWGAQLLPSDGVAYLQRLAWQLWRDLPLPRPGSADDDGLDDGILYDMQEHLIDYLRGTNAKGQSFDHLCFHPVARGFWIPVDFESVKLVDRAFGGCLGSSVRLLRELEWVATELELDLAMDHDDKAVWHARDNPGAGTAKWQQYGIESFNCLRMYRACQKSVELGAAVRFS